MDTESGMADDSSALDYRHWQVPSFDEGAEGEPEAPGEPGEAHWPVAGAGEGGDEFAPGQPAHPFGGGEDFDAGEHAAGTGGEAPGEPDFAAMKFLRENTLLSNAEKYAASVREEAELYVAQMRREVDRLNAEAEERYAEAERVKAEAEEQAEQVIAQARETTEDIREQARQEGREEGRAEGRRQRYEEAAPHLAHLEGILAELEQYRRQVAYYVEKDSVRLAVLMAKKILQQELRIDRKALWALLARTLAGMKEQGRFKVWVNPADHEFALAAHPSLSKYLGEDQTLSFRASPDVGAGNLQIETDREVIDLGIQSQFHYVEQALDQALAERETMVLHRPASVDHEEPGAPAPAGQDAPGRSASPGPDAPGPPAAAAAGSEPATDERSEDDDGDETPQQP